MQDHERRNEPPATGAPSALDLGDVDRDPMQQTARWLAEWRATNPVEPTAVVLATADARGRPSARMVLLKGTDEQGGFHVFTNYRSRKARDMEANPYASLLFTFDVLVRQIRVSGPVAKLPRAATEEYFATRPRGSQIGAWASPQSEVLRDRDVLEARVREIEERFRGKEVPAPEHWGGYRIQAEEFEFWQGRPNRLHDRLRYRSDGLGGWSIDRLAP